MTERTTDAIDRLVTTACDRYDDVTPAVVRQRAQMLLRGHDLSVEEAAKIIAGRHRVPTATTVEGVKSAPIEPKETTLIGLVTSVTEQPAEHARSAWVADGTGQLKVVLPVSAVATDAVGALQQFRRVGIQKHVPERYAYARDRTRVEPVRWAACVD